MHYKVEGIEEHKIIGGQRFFKIKWENYESKYNTWEPEDNLRNAKELLNNYLIDNQMEETTLESEEEDDEMGQENYMDPATILNEIKQLQRLNSYKTSTRIEQYLGGSLENHGIYLYIREQHHYVIVYLKDWQLVIDGANNSSRQEILKEIREETNLMGLRNLKFLQQQGNDHCGSSAIAIVIELIRWIEKFKEKLWNEESILVSPTLLHQLRKKYHKKKSESLNKKSKTIGLIRPKCSYCNRSFKTRAALIGHESHCKDK